MKNSSHSWKDMSPDARRVFGASVFLLVFVIATNIYPFAITIRSGSTDVLNESLPIGIGAIIYAMVCIASMVLSWRGYFRLAGWLIASGLIITLALPALIFSGLGLLVGLPIIIFSIGLAAVLHLSSRDIVWLISSSIFAFAILIVYDLLGLARLPAPEFLKSYIPLVIGIQVAILVIIGLLNVRPLLGRLRTLSPRARNAFFLVLGVSVGATLVETVLLRASVLNPSWQLTIMAGATATVLGFVVFGVNFAFEEKPQTSIGLVFTPLFLVFILSSALVSEQGIALLVSAAVLTILAVTIALPEDRSRLVFTVAGLGAGVIALLVDLYIPTERLVLPGFQAVVNILMAVFGILLLAILFSQIRNYSLTAKMVVVAMNAMFIPVILTTTYTIAVNTRAVTENADAQLLNAATGMGRELDTFISNNLNLVDTSSRIHILNEFLALPVADRPGSETESVLYTDLQAIADSNAFINSVGLMDKNGIDVADTVKGDVGTNKATHIYVSQPLQTGLPYSTTQISPTTHKFSLYFSAPVRDANDNVIGVLRIRYDASVLQQIVTDTANELNLPEASAALLDENQIFLAHSTQPQAILKSVVPFSQDTLTKLQASGRLPEGQSADDLSVNLPDLNLGLSQAANNAVFSAEIFDEEAAVDKGVEEIGAVQMKEQPWTVVVAQPQSIFLTPVVDLRRTYIVYTLVIAALIVIATILLARYIAQPLVDLTSATQKIAAGDLTVRANVTTKDEFGALSQVFNEMTGKLIRRASELATVAQVSTEAMQTTDTDILLQRVVDQTKSAFNLYHAHIYLLNEAKDTLVLTYGAGEVGRQMVAEQRSIPLDREQSLVARAARTRSGVIVNDVYADPGFLPHPLLPETRSEMAVPMTAGDVVIGVFDVQSDVIGRFTDEDIAIQTTLASQIASAVQTARSYTEVQRNEALLSDALNISRLANWEYDLEHDLFTFNDNFYSIFRTSAENVGGYRMSSSDYARRFVHPEDAPLVGIEIQKALDSKERSFKAAVEHRTIFADGEIGYMTVRINVERDENGKIVRWYGANQDITERHRLEEINRKRAIQQETLNVITQKIQSATTVEEAMQITARELGHALGMKPTLVALEPGALVNGPEGN